MFDRYQAPARFFTMTLAGATLLISAPAAAQEAHGVIAFGTETDQDNGVAYGFAWNFPAKETALVEAMNACIASGGTNCVQLAWFQDGCGALAMDQHGNAQGKPGMTLEQAEARALRACKAAGGAECDIVGSLCAGPGGEPRTWSGSESVLPLPDAETTAAGPADVSLTREERVRLQQALTALGFDAGPADGVFGPRARAAIWDWQEANGHEATGYVTREQAASLAAVAASPDREQEPPQEAADHLSGNVLIFGPETGPKCEEMSKGAKCWHEPANQPGCYFFNTHYLPSKTVTWSGACTGGIAVGPGAMEFRSPGKPTQEATGTLVWGKFDGHWAWRSSDGHVSEGPYVDGEEHGHWVQRGPAGGVAEGPYVDGERHGHWVWRDPNGRAEEGAYMNSKRHGRWVYRDVEGTVREVIYENGELVSEPGTETDRAPVEAAPPSAADAFDSGWVTCFVAYENSTQCTEFRFNDASWLESFRDLCTDLRDGKACTGGPSCRRDMGYGIQIDYFFDDYCGPGEDDCKRAFIDLCKDGGDILQ